MPRYVIGIDLGTTNSALAYWREGGPDASELCAIPQLTAPGRVAAAVTLPSSLYVPLPGELTPDDARLPWDGSQAAGKAALPAAGEVVGLWARERGAQVPERLVSSAKSWLGNGTVDRYAPVLPWRSEMTEGKLSPVDASQRYLQHLLAAFEYDRRAAGEPVDWETSEVVLAVPASFDEVARNLTYEAARRAGLARPVLLEEPLAAFYAWLAHDESGWRRHVAPGDVVLVVDIGGGTTDFSLIAVGEAEGQLRLERVAVGDHLLLGGDNMDLALAHLTKLDLEQAGRALDHWQFLSLVGAARDAKERLFAEPDLAEMPLSVASRGAGLFGGTLSATLTRQRLTETLVDGFFPLTRVDELPVARRSVGIQELGLNYEAEPAVSRHLARFLRRAYQNVRGQAALAALVADRVRDEVQHVMPTAVLFNGGVFKAPALRERLLELLRGWNGGVEVKELGGTDVDLAVAFGGAAYGKLRVTGRGIRVQSGTARSYYVGLESPAPAVPGLTPPVKGLCLVPQGTDEGTEIELSAQQLGLVVGEPVEFRFFSSAVRSGDAVGTLVDDAPGLLEESARLQITLPAEGRREGDVVPVRLDAVINEVGVLQLYMKDVATEQKWNLEFNVRPHEHG